MVVDLATFHLNVSKFFFYCFKFLFNGWVKVFNDQID